MFCVNTESDRYLLLAGFSEKKHFSSNFQTNAGSFHILDGKFRHSMAQSQTKYPLFLPPPLIQAFVLHVNFILGSVYFSWCAHKPEAAYDIEYVSTTDDKQILSEQFQWFHDCSNDVVYKDKHFIL